MEMGALPLPWGILHAVNFASVADDPIPIDLTADEADLTTLRRRTFFLQADEEALMRKTEFATTELHGIYRDVIRDAGGTVISDSGWRKNLILDGFRKLLASFAHGPGAAPPSNALGIEEVQFGRGDPAWDVTPPTPDPTRTALTDAGFISVPRFLAAATPNPDFQIQFLVGGVGSPTETNIVEVVATLQTTGPGPSVTLREFGLVGRLNGNPLLLNHVAHPAIAKDPTTTLTRTVRFVF
ncbi:MAG: hypothetical protein AUI36_33830 [Cyanobacteria bacterium 13_1_40CM_2_61_4]|nr:MAG: hypothetical protein AUI36_33830 [Cyanobacteria bacterium 13_1_40CM_2_61_4]